MKNLILKSLATVACLLAASSSYASLILVAPENFGGSGLGAVNMRHHGLYLIPPDQALVLCVDEKIHIQALERPQSMLPMG